MIFIRPANSVVTIYYFGFAKKARGKGGKERKEGMGEYSFPSFPSLPSFSLALHVINKVLDGEHREFYFAKITARVGR